MKKIIALVTITAFLLVNTTALALAETQFNIKNHGDWSTIPSAESISREDAADIAAEALKRLFGADLHGATLNMFYVEGSNNQIHLSPQNRAIEMPSMWRGFINPENGDWSTFTFAINAETGELLEATYDSSAVESVERGLSAGRIVDFSDFENFTLNAQLNYEYSNLAMDIAQRLEILSSEVMQARIVTQGLGANAISEPVLTILVEVQSVGGESITLGFDTHANNEPVLSLVRGGLKAFSFRAGDVERFEWVERYVDL